MLAVRGDSQVAAVIKHQLGESNAVVERGEEGGAPRRIGCEAGRHYNSGCLE
jgi:hypothetical protein